VDAANKPRHRHSQHFSVAAISAGWEIHNDRNRLGRDSYRINRTPSPQREASDCACQRLIVTRNSLERDNPQ
jgi:hypothetical protein